MRHAKKQKTMIHTEGTKKDSIDKCWVSTNVGFSRLICWSSYISIIKKLQRKRKSELVIVELKCVVTETKIH